MKFLPIWKDRDGNKFVRSGMDYVFDTHYAAHVYQVADFMFYIPFGWRTAGIFEMEMNGTRGSFAHVAADHPTLGPIAIIEGPLFDAATGKSV